MNRRRFIASIAAIGVAAALPQVLPIIDSAPAHPLGTRAIDANGNAFVYVRAIRDNRLGDLVIADGSPFGVAMQDMQRGQCGWIQVYGYYNNIQFVSDEGAISLAS